MDIPYLKSWVGGGVAGSLAGAVMMLSAFYFINDIMDKQNDFCALVVGTQGGRNINMLRNRCN